MQKLERVWENLKCLRAIFYFWNIVSIVLLAAYTNINNNKNSNNNNNNNNISENNTDDVKLPGCLNYEGMKRFKNKIYKSRTQLKWNCFTYNIIFVVFRFLNFVLYFPFCLQVTMNMASTYSF